MQIKIKRPFLERALSPIAFQQNELINVPDKVAKSLIKAGRAVSVDSIKTPTGRP